MNLPKGVMLTRNVNELKPSTLWGIKLMRMFFWLMVVFGGAGSILLGVGIGLKDHPNRDWNNDVAIFIGIINLTLFVISIIGYYASHILKLWELPMKEKKANKYMNKLKRYEYYNLLWVLDKQKANKAKEIKHEHKEKSKEEIKNL